MFYNCFLNIDNNFEVFAALNFTATSINIFIFEAVKFKAANTS